MSRRPMPLADANPWPEPAAAEPLTEQDRASLQDDLQMEERALERHLDKEPLYL